MEVCDTSRPISEIRSYDVPTTLETLNYYATSTQFTEPPNKITTQHDDCFDDIIAYTDRIPLGTTLGIGAWNYPLVNCASKSIPSILFGNSMIYKPSEYTPSSALFMAELYEEAGLPEGLFQVLLGGGKSGNSNNNDNNNSGDNGMNVGQTLVEEYCSSILDCNTHGKISFTGSVNTGHQIAKQTTCKNGSNANFTFHRLNLELGGKSPLIILDDCNIDNAVQNAIMANWYSNGQVCSNGTRVYVHESKYDTFVSKLIDETSKLKIGHPMNDDVDIGPMISKEHMDRVLRYIDIGKHEDGATLYYGGERLCGPIKYGHNKDGGEDSQSFMYEYGNFLSPAIFADCTDDMKIVQEEIFGMVMTIMKFQDEKEVIQRANATKYGLAAGIITNDVNRAKRISSQLMAGTVWINTYNVANIAIPWGGFKQSGIGHENGIAAMEAWTTQKVTFVQTK